MASFWGLPGTDISSQLSSLSETVIGKDEKITVEKAPTVMMFRSFLDCRFNYHLV